MTKIDTTIRIAEPKRIDLELGRAVLRCTDSGGRHNFPRRHPKVVVGGAWRGWGLRKMKPLGNGTVA